MSRDITLLQNKSLQLRKDVFEMIYNAQSGHVGGSFSIIETLVALYFDTMKCDPKNPHDPDRDRFVLSKGHTAPAIYAVLAEAGFYPKTWLMDSFRTINAKLQGHPDMKKTPGIDMTSGSLGIGLSAANGMALAGKVKGKSYNVYCMMGDGEINEGQIWEAAATAAHFGLDNVIAFVDVNGLQNDGKTVDVKNMGDIAEKWRSFGWYVQEIDGHNFDEIFAAIDNAKACKKRPSVIVQHTVKGKGLSFAENCVVWHGKTPNKDEYLAAMKELCQ